MNRTDRLVRAAVYGQFIDEGTRPTVPSIARRLKAQERDVAESLSRLAAEHRLVLDDAGAEVVMAHPFSGMPTGYRAEIAGRTWAANCGWDAFAILAMLGDGNAVCTSPVDGIERTWEVTGGFVAEQGLIHFVVPAARFWDDIGFT